MTNQLSNSQNATPNDPVTPSNNFWKIFALITGVLGIIGFVLSIYFWYEGKSSVDLNFAVHPVKAVLLQTDQSSKLKATYEGKPVEGNVTTVQVALWNKGKKSIRAEQILNDRKSILISTENGIPILDATLRKSSREVVQCSINTDELPQGKLWISWKIFEQNDGCIIQIIYQGNQNNQISANGVIEGQPAINIFTISQAETSKLPSIPLASLIWVISWLLLYIILMIILEYKSERLPMSLWQAFNPLNKKLKMNKTILNKELIGMVIFSLVVLITSSCFLIYFIYKGFYPDLPLKFDY